jgi:hypothetical protein
MTLVLAACIHWVYVGYNISVGSMADANLSFGP